MSQEEINKEFYLIKQRLNNIEEYLYEHQNSDANIITKFLTRHWRIVLIVGATFAAFYEIIRHFLSINGN